MLRFSRGCWQFRLQRSAASYWLPRQVHLSLHAIRLVEPMRLELVTIDTGAVT